MTPLIRSGQTWVALGDSITEDPAGYVGLCAAALPGVRVINAGISGHKARDMRARLETDVLRHKPDLVSISVGVNDVMHGFWDFALDRPRSTFDPAAGEPLEDYRSDLSSMVGSVLASGAKLILVSPTMIGEVRDGRENKLLQSYIDAMKDIAVSSGAIYCAMNESMWSGLGAMREKQPDASMTWDGVHMLPIGDRTMAEIFLRTINELYFFTTPD